MRRRVRAAGRRAGRTPGRERLALTVGLLLGLLSVAAQPGHEGHFHGSPRPTLDFAHAIRGIVIVLAAAVVLSAVRAMLVDKPWLRNAGAMPHERTARRRRRWQALGLLLGLVVGMGTHEIVHHRAHLADRLGASDPAMLADTPSPDELDGDVHDHDHAGPGEGRHRAVYLLLGAAVGSLGGLAFGVLRSPTLADAPAPEPTHSPPA